MITAAFPYWDCRLAPVFDSARNVCLVKKEAGKIVKEVRMSLPEDPPVKRAMFLAEQGVEILVCGAISRQLQAMISAYSIRILPFQTGELTEIISAWIEGRLHNNVYTMPGCYGRCGSRGSGRHNRNNQNE